MTLKTFAIASMFAVACTPVDTTPEPTESCATTTCDPNATCSDADGVATCTCNAGFSGDGAACSDVNECSAANACKPGNACVNASGGFDCLPTSCAGVLANQPDAVDGTYTLYVNGDPKKPWEAFCADMQLASGPAEYLPLVEVLGDHNFSQYTAGGFSPGTDVRTSYVRLRLDPATLKVAIADQRFATSSGQLSHAGAGPVTEMPFGVAMSCGNTPGRANIDLRGTAFVVADTFVAGGSIDAVQMNTSIDPAKQFVDLSGGGLCGWNASSGAPFNPFNVAAGTLQLAYFE